MVFPELATLAKTAAKGNLYVYGRNIYGQKNPVPVKEMARTYRKRGRPSGTSSRNYRSIKRPRYNQRLSYGSKYKNGAPTTFQSQYATDYVKRRVPKYKKIRGKKKYRAFKRMLFKSVGCKHFVFRHQARTEWADNKQQWIDIPMYACNGARESQPGGERYTHMFTMADDMERNTGGDVPAERYGIVRSSYAQMDLQMVNRSGSVQIINVYYYYCKKDLNVDDASADTITEQGDSTPIGLLKAVKNLHFPHGELTTNARFDDIGFTPFQSPRFCKYFTIYKKQRFQLAPNQTITDMLKDKKLKEWQYNGVFSLVAKKGSTTGMLISVHSMYDGEAFPENNPPIPSDYPSGILDWSTQYTYNCKVLRENNTDEIIYKPTTL